MITFDTIIRSLPPSLPQYIEAVDEWIMLLNNSVRRSVIQTRRYRQHTTDAPLPIYITSMPLINGIDEIPQEYREHYTNSIEGYSIWTNGVEESLNPSYSRDGNKVIIPTSQFGADSGKYINKDLTLLYISTNAEYSVLKFIEYNTTLNQFEYIVVPVYTEEILPHRELRTRVVVPSKTNLKTSYYFTPAHTIDSLWDRPENPRTLPTITASFDTTNQITITNFYNGQNYISDVLNAFNNGIITLTDTDGNSITGPGIFIAGSMQAGTDTTGTAQIFLGDGSTSITFAFSLTFTTQVTPSLAEDFPLTEKCLIDPVLLNLVSLELKKSFYQFTDDTTDLGLINQYQIEIDREIERTRNAGQVTLQKALRNDNVGLKSELQYSTRNLI